MNLLFIIPYVPDRIRVRPYNLIKSLAHLGHSITLFTIWSDDHEKKSLEEIKKYCQAVKFFHLSKYRSLSQCLAALPSKIPLQAVYSHYRELVSELNTILQDEASFIDVVHVEHLRGVQYALSTQEKLKSIGRKIPVVWDSVDSITNLFRQASKASQNFSKRMILQVELGRTEAYEKWLMHQLEFILVTSPVDRDVFLSLIHPQEDMADIRVLTNGVDLDYFRPVDEGQREDSTLVISGKMSYHANIAMVRYLMDEIMPLVWKERPEAKVLIVGKNPPKSVREYASNLNVTVTGTVADIRPYLARATVAVAPLTYGTGVQNKILEAMACGTPVITSPQGNQSLFARPREDILVAKNANEFAAGILELFASPHLRKKIGDAGRGYVEKYHNWLSIAGDLVSYYQDFAKEL